jgi:hypothetical protein
MQHRPFSFLWQRIKEFIDSAALLKHPETIAVDRANKQTRRTRGKCGKASVRLSGSLLDTLL